LSNNIFIILVCLIEIVVAVALIVFVLLHSGKGTGVSSMLGGVMSQAGASAGIVERNLDRITVGLAIAFAITSVILAYGYHATPTVTKTTGTTNSAPANTTTTKTP
jgi:preprotein translocase subunit SecG